MFRFEQEKLDKFLKDLKYPLSRRTLIEQVEAQDLPPATLGLLQRLENRDYRSAEDVEQELGAHKA